MSIENWIQLLIPVISIVAAIISAAISYYLSEKSKITAREKRLKEKCYIEYIEALSHNVLSDDLDESKSRLSQASNQILLIGSAEVVRNMRRFAECIGPTNSAFSQEQHDLLLSNLLKSMRTDLYQSHRINDGYPQIGVLGKRRRA